VLYIGTPDIFPMETDCIVATLLLVGLGVTLLSANPGLAWRRALMQACGLAEGSGEGGPEGLGAVVLEVSTSVFDPVVAMLYNKVPQSSRRHYIGVRSKQQNKKKFRRKSIPVADSLAVSFS